jgi:hypothetical protein
MRGRRQQEFLGRPDMTGIDSNYPAVRSINIWAPYDRTVGPTVGAELFLRSSRAVSPPPPP